MRLRSAGAADRHGDGPTEGAIAARGCRGCPEGAAGANVDYALASGLPATAVRSSHTLSNRPGWLTFAARDDIGTPSANGRRVLMADKYRNFAELARSESSGIDYDVLVRRARPAFAIIAPHGGGIEPGTSEIADAVADRTHSFYAFEGLKPSGNTDLHITSTRFDEPMCLTVLGHTEVVVTLHGEHSEDDGEGVFSAASTRC